VVSRSAEIKDYPVVGALIDSFAQWLKHRRDVAETCNCDPGELDRIAHELGVSRGELDDLVRRGPHAADELPRMMAALNLDAAAVARTEPLLMHDMERICAHCASKRQCREDLDEGTALQNYDEYCGNTLTLRALVGKRH